MSRPLDEDGMPAGMLAPLDEGSGPARRLSRQKSAALVQAAMLAALDAPSPPPRPRRRYEWLMGGALLVVGATAVATWHLSRRSESGAPVEPSIVASPTVLEPARPEQVDVERASPEVTGVGGARALPDGTGVSGGRPESEGAGVDGSRAESEVPGVDAARPEVIAPPPSTKPRVEHRLPGAPAPEDLLRRANEHRATGQWKAAEALYLRVIRTDPKDMSAYVARVASGSLRLEHLGDARGALRQYQEAQRGWPGGILEEEASHGVAEALRALGDRDGEARALEAFLARHPDSPHGVAARTRLREISGR
ncbi:tetratricopeptide repeat protein [Myxococcus sp. AM011]|uniref:tetratricopeptide repeat protein n=1 Tax=Myxococcus sp. AM011 TaxID=2745200 RepID=UPI0015951DF3|nr:tetratricopeptide repeat protein [Myxococcus sp. AM011]NVJ25708.1 tetratricopeptide repeat protein [Myxococcus sp. AM011]